MARMTFKGLEEYALRLSRLGDGIPQIAGKATYAGAQIVADKVKANLDALNVTTSELAMRAYSNGTPTYITEEAKRGLIESFGISKMQEKNGYYNVKLGFDGYNDVVTKQYPKGQPNNLIARACESGSSAMIKQPFMRTAVNASRKAAEQKMAEIIDAEIKKKMEE